ncbi:MAG: bifunctional protein-serine/threonine kinase/phosphatase [Gammaproteobacteria bacterium]|jgi:serine/threonine protein phosphatase PrpC|nr:bifunctional protein-serine/threonine kinase/phosphatase [Gammaproteobacteria bacterium]
MEPIVVGQVSSAGIKPANDDACGVHIPQGSQLYNKGIIAVIADGVSSSAGAAEASHSCVQGFINDYYSTPESWTVSTSASKIFSALNQWLLGHGQRVFSNSRDMVTTLSVLVIKSSTAYIFHVGDSRIYHCRSGVAEQITNDHHVQGRGDKRYLGRAMGINHHIEVDAHKLSVNQEDGFLLTTDGLHEFISSSEINGVIAQYADQPQLIADTLLTMALENGSDDNISCQYVQVNQLPAEDEQSFYERIQELPFAPELSVGMSMDGFKILRELHSSARTQLYLAYDIQQERQVILKTPSVNYEDDSTYLDTFQHEEWAGLRTHSPHVMRVYDIRERRRFLYYVSEYINGITLRQWMADHPQPTLQEVRAIAEQIIRGLRTFHRLEMVHRDLKPENIMIDSHGTVKIIDFGSTRISGIEEISSPVDHSRILGTRNYTAPEIIAGGSGSPFSDQFSLAVILYEMLSGKLPYGDLGDHPSIEKLLRKIKHSHYTVLNHHTKEVPVWMAASIQKALDPSPAKRYPAFSEFYHDLIQANPLFRIDHHTPFIERDPLSFWRGLSLLLIVTNITLLILLNT